MKTVKNITIEGFWGRRSIHIDFDKELNFLIGRNGSGKTTIINILSAAIRLSFQELDQAQFSKIIVQFNNSGTRTISELQYIRSRGRPQYESPGYQYTVRYRPSSKSPWIEQNMGEFWAYRRRARPNRFETLAELALTESKIDANYPFDQIRSELTSTLMSTWLSIHRTTLARRYETNRETESTVDAKLNEITSNFSNFFAGLHSRTQKPNQDFLESVFLSLLYTQRRQSSIEAMASELQDSTITDLKEIFGSYKVAEKNYANRLTTHFEAINRARTPRLSSQQGYTLNELITIFDGRRIADLVAQWRKSQDAIRELLRPKSDFIDVMNRLLLRKTLSFDDRNQPVIRTDDGRTFGPEALSSGEKQLFILLGEALLQESRPFVFIADEPELSLHVEWQDRLVHALRSMNPRMQIIFATHSPDIVSTFQDRVIDIESVTE